LHHHGDSPIYRLLLIETDQASIKPESPFSLQELWGIRPRRCHDNVETFSPEPLRTVCAKGTLAALPRLPHFWKDSNRDFPIVKQVNAEYAKLR